MAGEGRYVGFVGGGASGGIREEGGGVGAKAARGAGEEQGARNGGEQEIRRLQGEVSTHEHSLSAARAEKSAEDSRHATSEEALRAQLAAQREQLAELRSASARFEGYRSEAEDEKAAGQALYKEVAQLSAAVESEQQRRGHAEAALGAMEERLAGLAKHMEESEGRLRTDLARERAQVSDRDRVVAERDQQIRQLKGEVSNHESGHAATLAERDASERSARSEREALQRQLAEQRQELWELQTFTAELERHKSALSLSADESIAWKRTIDDSIRRSSPQSRKTRR